MKPYLHSKISSQKFGGKPEDYLEIHDFMDLSKSHFPDVRHRALLHNSFGIYIAEMVFGHNITNSDGKLVSVRDIAEQHVLDDLGTIPTVQDYLEHMEIQTWMGGIVKKRKQTTTLEELIPEQPLITPGTEEVGPATKPTITIDREEIYKEIQKQAQKEAEEWLRKYPGIKYPGPGDFFD